MKIASDLRECAKLFMHWPEKRIRSKGPSRQERPAIKRLCGFLDEEAGNELIELALVMPIFLILTFGLFKFGIAMNNQLILTQATGAGAQYLQQIRTNTTDPCADTFNKIRAAAPTLTSDQITVAVTMNGVTPQATGNNSCSGAQTNLVQGGPITVATSYPCDLTINVNSQVNVVVPGCQLHAQVTEYEY